MNPVALERAEKGLAWLKESGPVHGLYVNLVNLEILNLGNGCQCVLGQLGGQEYMAVMDHLQATEAIPSDLQGRANWAREHGFVDDPRADVYFGDLNEAWRNLLLLDREIPL
jgi:hypothetical protein